MKRLNTIAAATIVAFALAACGADADSGPEGTSLSEEDLDSLYEQAQEEGQVVIYGPYEERYRPVYEAFMDEYPGIEVTGANIFGPELDARLEGEAFAGGFEADLVHIATSDLARYNDSEYLVGFEPQQKDDLEDQFLGPDGAWTIPSQQLYGVLYNTENTSPEELPSDWDEVIEADWPGGLALSDPTISGMTPQVFSALLDSELIDESWVDSLANDVSPTIFPSVAASMQETTVGDTDGTLVAGYSTYIPQEAEGAPIGFHVMDEGAFMADVAFGVLDDSPNPSAARLLVNWMFTPEGQASVAEHMHEFGTMPDAPLPEGADDLGEFEQITYPGEDTYVEALELLNENF